MGEAIADESALLPDAALAQMEIVNFIQTWLKLLTDKQRSVIEQRYGLNNFEAATLEQIADGLNLSRERVRQIQAEALLLLRKQVRRAGIDKAGLL
jgi:RNA polymerase nonessential primary-like sigma factor